MRAAQTGAILLAVISVAPMRAQPTTDAARWKIFITNDNCPDYTWGLSETQTRQAFADIVKGHLDEMKRTDARSFSSRDRYNMAVTQEALCFVERYPEREEELILRIREGRVYVSPYLCNSLWALQSAEGAIRTFYPARRLEREWGISIDCAHHIELPSLPWGTATILAGCGIRSLSNPYLGYDSTFGGLRNPPLFLLEGPDSSRIRVWLDRWASSKSNYTQGAAILRHPDAITKEWLPHYAGLGDVYPLRVILASGTHGDISLRAGGQARGFADAIIEYNARPGPHPELVNATFPQFWRAVDSFQAKTPFLKTLRGSFGHSWDLWPVALAKYVAEMRQGERTFLAAEALLAVAGTVRSEIDQETRRLRERAEWCWSMLSDHAWNGTGEKNKRLNADLRRRWSQELNRTSRDLVQRGWAALDLEPSDSHVTLFNPSSLERAGLVSVDAPGGMAISQANADGERLPCQSVVDGDRRLLCFVTPPIPGFGWRQVTLERGSEVPIRRSELNASSRHLESPFYRVTVDPETGGISSLVHKATGVELVRSGNDSTLCQTLYFDGNEHRLTNVSSEPYESGPVLARLGIRGELTGVEVTNIVTVYAELDRLDCDVHIKKTPSARKERLCHAFPILGDSAQLRIASAGAVVRPRPQPEGDLLPGADTRRFAVQEFVHFESDSISVTVVPLDAFALRLDLGMVCFEALGNDQNYREVLRDQNGETSFRFRYSLQARAGGYDGGAVIGFSRSAATPLLTALGRLPISPEKLPSARIDAAIAIATCWKPADDTATGGTILRFWETAGATGLLTVDVRGFRSAVQTDLLERDGAEVPIVNGRLRVAIKSHGYGALRLVPKSRRATEE